MKISRSVSFTLCCDWDTRRLRKLPGLTPWRLAEPALEHPCQGGAGEAGEIYYYFLNKLHPSSNNLRHPAQLWALLLGCEGLVKACCGAAQAGVHSLYRRHTFV